MNMLNILKKIIILFLMPISFVWDMVHRFRRFAYSSGLINQNSFQVPIISVGNITFGGSGKTPFTLWLAHYFESLDNKVMVLMRGYKGNRESDAGILHARNKLGFNPKEYGDEALILAVEVLKIVSEQFKII